MFFHFSTGSTKIFFVHQSFLYVQNSKKEIEHFIVGAREAAKVVNLEEAPTPLRGSVKCLNHWLHFFSCFCNPIYDSLNLLELKPFTSISDSICAASIIIH